ANSHLRHLCPWKRCRTPVLRPRLRRHRPTCSPPHSCSCLRPAFPPSTSRAFSEASGSALPAAAPTPGLRTHRQGPRGYHRHQEHYLGIGVAALVAGLLAQYASWPLHLSFVVYLVVLGAVAILIWFTRETVIHPEMARLTIHPKLALRTVSVRNSLRLRSRASD